MNLLFFLFFLLSKLLKWYLFLSNDFWYYQFISLLDRIFDQYKIRYVRVVKLGAHS